MKDTELPKYRTLICTGLSHATYIKIVRFSALYSSIRSHLHEILISVEKVLPPSLHDVTRHLPLVGHTLSVSGKVKILLVLTDISCLST